MSKSKKKSPAPIKVGQKKSAQAATVMSAERQHMISEAAYFLAEQRGFSPGDELGDWLEAESQINASLSQ